MIVDKIENWKIYFKAPVFAQIFKDLESYTTQTSNGVYKNHENYYFKVMTYDTKLDSKIIESHKKEVDIHILLTGNEHIKVYDASAVEVTEGYDAESDCQFYKRTGNPECEIDLKPGYMAVLFPDDIHHPQYAVRNNVETLKKIVIKVDEKLFA